MAAAVERGVAEELGRPAEACPLGSGAILLTDEQLGRLRDLATVCGFQAVSDPPGWLRAEEPADVTAYLSARPAVVRKGRYVFAIDGREVDFGPAVAPGGQWYPIS